MTTGKPWKRARPQTIAGSSANLLSPWSSTKSSNKRSMRSSVYGRSLCRASCTRSKAVRWSASFAGSGESFSFLSLAIRLLCFFADRFDSHRATQFFQSLLQFATTLHAQSVVWPYSHERAVGDQSLESDFAIAWIQIDQRQNRVAQAREVVMLRCAQDKKLVAPFGRIETLYLIHDDRRGIVFAQLQLADHNSRQLILREGA